mmetsp:Transcript_28972/g.71558  ORF Transcript_28972/g.71558 Transcript_28972/m.71558 type:complete len:80 (-) Transcript_28972:1745-1984(-)
MFGILHIDELLRGSGDCWKVCESFTDAARRWISSLPERFYASFSLVSWNCGKKPTGGLRIIDEGVPRMSRNFFLVRHRP